MGAKVAMEEHWWIIQYPAPCRAAGSFLTLCCDQSCAWLLPQMMLDQYLPKHNAARILGTAHCKMQFLSLIRFSVGGVGLCKSFLNCSNHCNYCTVTTKWITVLIEPSGLATELYNTILSDCDPKKQFWSFGLQWALSLTITIKKKKRLLTYFSVFYSAIVQIYS